MSAVKSGFFSLLTRFCNVVFAVCFLAIMGRLLTPEIFGVYGIAVAVYNFFVPFIDMGLLPAYLKEEQHQERTENIYFSLYFFLGLASAVIFVVTSFLSVKMYSYNLYYYIFSVMGVTLFMQALSRQPQASFFYQKRFDIVFICNTIVMFLGNVIAVVLAFYDFGVWSLVFNYFVIECLRLSIYFLFFKKRYKLISLPEIFKSPTNIRHGGKIFIARIPQQISVLMYKSFSGYMFTGNTLGFCMKLYDIAIMPDAYLRTSLTTPALAHLKEGSKAKYDFLLHIILSVVLIPCAFFVIKGDLFFTLLLGNNWSTYAYLFKYFGWFGFFYVLINITRLLLLNEKKSNALIKLNMTICVFTALFFLFYFLKKEADIETFIKLYTGFNCVLYASLTVYTYGVIVKNFLVALLFIVKKALTFFFVVLFSGYIISFFDRVFEGGFVLPHLYSIAIISVFAFLITLMFDFSDCRNIYDVFFKRFFKRVFRRG